jgi:hemoglobin
MNATSTNTATTQRPSYYELLGNSAGIHQLVNHFYDEMDSATDLRELRAMHATDLAHMRATLTEFLIGWLGGPRTYWERANAKCMMSAHAPIPISRCAAMQWVTCMQRAMRKLSIDDAVRNALDHAFTKVCTAMVNRS